MVNLNIDWSRGWILSCFFGCEGKIHKPKPWIYPEIFPVFSYDKTSQHSKWMDNLNVDWSSGWILSCFVGREGKIHKPKPRINQACKEIHTATLGMKLTSVVCKLEIKINLSKSKVKLHPLLQIHIHHQMCNLVLILNQYAPPNVEWRPYSKSICTTCQNWNEGPSACKLSVQTTTPPVLDTILIEQQAIILPR